MYPSRISNQVTGRGMLLDSMGDWGILIFFVCYGDLVVRLFLVYAGQ